MSIRLQVLFSLALMFLLSCVMFVATWSVTSSQKVDGSVINLAGRQRMQVQKIAKDALAYAHLARTGGASAALAADVRQRLADFSAVQARLIAGGDTQDGKRFHVPKAGREAAARLTAAAALLEPFAAQVQFLLEKPDAVAADKLLAASEALVVAQDKAVDQLQANAEGDTTTLMIIQAGGMTLSAVVFLGVLVLLRRRLNAPLTRLRQYAAAVADGDLKARATGRYPVELAELRDDLDRMVVALEQNMSACQDKGAEAERNAAEAHDALAAARENGARTDALLARMHEAAAKAMDVSASVMDESASLLEQTRQVSGGAQLQRDRMMETATAMEEMNATVLEVARNAASAAESADAAKSKAVTGAEGVRSAVDSIETIRQRILDLKESMTRLGQQADNIGHIMNVITDIADQTNLLALNAAIEAARAGDAGRGFAVVADEVRKLAEKTMAATKEVGEAIAGIQQGTTQTVSLVDGAVASVEEATALAKSSGSALADIVAVVEAAGDQVRAIATAAEEQSASVEEVNQSVAAINRIASETADAMLQSATAVTELADQAQGLSVLVAEIRGDGQAALPA